MWPWLFRLPWFRRFDGYSAWGTILLRRPPVRNSLSDRIDPVTEAYSSDDLVTHELCHVWQLQHRPVRMPLSYLGGYAENRHEVEARRAVELTK